MLMVKSLACRTYNVLLILYKVTNYTLQTTHTHPYPTQPQTNNFYIQSLIMHLNITFAHNPFSSTHSNIPYMCLIQTFAVMLHESFLSAPFDFS